MNDNFNFFISPAKLDGKDILVVHPDTVRFCELRKTGDDYEIVFDKFTVPATVYTNKAGELMCMPTALKKFYNF